MPLSREELQRRVDVRAESSSEAEAARRLGLDRPSLRSTLERAQREGILPTIQSEPKPPISPPSNLNEAVRAALIGAPRTLAELGSKTGAELGQILDALDGLKEAGINLLRVGDRYEIPRQASPAYASEGEIFEFVSDADNRFLFGAVGDNHCGSKYERRDVFADLYDRFAAAGVTKVFHTGNWIEGECRFNRHDLVAVGLEPQCKLLAETYPARAGITTYAIWGDDHEGWLAQREGVDVGTYAESVMRRAGRDDWHNLGFMEAHVKLVNANTGTASIMSVVHPGGGSAYALSYSIQKIIESLEGGEKPAVGLYGHFHKLWSGNIRNVWCLQTGAGQDQTPFMRKKRLEAHVGGVLVRMEQDPESGAIIGFQPTMQRYFNRGFYNNRWSHHGLVTLSDRGI